MAKTSAGLLLFRRTARGTEVFLVHPGGPFWANRDDGAWSIPKGEIAAGEDPLAAARREFTEETGLTVSGNFTPLAPITQKGGKIVHAWAIEADVDPAQVQSNTFTFKGKEFPEIDRAAWFSLEAARAKILESQSPLLGQLAQFL